MPLLCSVEMSEHQVCNGVNVFTSTFTDPIWASERDAGLTKRRLPGQQHIVHVKQRDRDLILPRDVCQHLNIELQVIGMQVTSYGDFD